MKNKLLLSCLSLLVSGTMFGMEGQNSSTKDWYIILESVTNKSIGTASVSIKKPGFSTKETHIIRPKDSLLYLLHRSYQLKLP